MAKSGGQAAGNKRGASNKSGGNAGETGNPASNTAATGNAQLVQSRPDTAMAAAMAKSPLQPVADPAAQSAIAALKQDHRRVEALFSEFETATEEQRQQDVVEKICAELNIHTRLEEEIFYPACREAIHDEDLMDEAQVEHDAAKLLIADLTQASSDDAYYEAKVKLLSEMIKHHVAEEERPGEGVFAKAQTHNVDNPSLASELAERKQELQRRAARLRPTRAVSFNLDLINLIEEDSMARYSDSDRDERGRFTGDRGGGRMGSGRSSGRRYDDDDGDRSGRGGRGGWFGDSEGHARAARERFDADDDRGGRFRRRDDDDRDDRGRFRSGGRDDDDGRDDRGRFQSRGRDDDDDRDDRGRFRSRGRDDDDDRDDRGRFQSRGRDDDDDRDDRGRFRSRDRDDYDDDRGGRGRGGWFGDSEGHARAARSRRDDDDDRRGVGREGPRTRDDDDDDRGGRGRDRGGWFGDSEGHSRAARSRRDDDDDRGSRGRSGSRSRSRDDDDDDGRGWFGDSRGHAQAARRGWENRR